MIEVSAPTGGFDEAFADQLAQLEAYNKHLYRPNTYLHKWWARRCGTTFRLILKHLVTDPGRRDYYSAGGLAGKLILDPMMGGGTTLHEAIRLGANVIGVDIDPIPVLQARASLTQLPLSSLEAAFAELAQKLEEQLAAYFVTDCPDCLQPSAFSLQPSAFSSIRFTLYGLRRACECGPAIFVDSLLLRQERNREAAVRLCPRCHAVVGNDAGCNCLAAQEKPPLLEKGMNVCRRCGGAYQEDLAAPFYSRYVPLAIAGHCPEHGFLLKSPTAADQALIRAADNERPGLDFGGESRPPDFAVRPGPKSADLLRRGVTSYLDLFSSRQLLYLHHAINLLPAFDPLVRLNLALLLSTSLEFNSMLCGYKGSSRRRPGAIRHTFSLHAYSFPYTALENNFLYPQKASGTLQKLFHDRIRRARRWAGRPQERCLSGSASGRSLAGGGVARYVAISGEVDAGVEVGDAASLLQGRRRFLLIQGSSAQLDLAPDSVDYVVTDPPYFDSVQYSDLAAFFRVWLQRLLPAGKNKEAAGVRWEYDLSGAAVEPQANGDQQYTAVITAIFRECHRVLRKEHGRLIFTFHHWNPKGWAAITVALKEAGFVLVNRYAVHAENPVSVHIANFDALTHDAILVLAPREAGLKPEWGPPSRPPAVDRRESRQFCRDCATLLGWLLNQTLPAAAIEQQWRDALKR